MGDFGHFFGVVGETVFPMDGEVCDVDGRVGADGGGEDDELFEGVVKGFAHAGSFGEDVDIHEAKSASADVDAVGEVVIKDGGTHFGHGGDEVEEAFDLLIGGFELAIPGDVGGEGGVFV